MDYSVRFPAEEIEKFEVWQPDCPAGPAKQPRQASLDIKLILRHRYIRLRPPADAVLEGVEDTPRRLQTTLDMSVFEDYDVSYARLSCDLYLLGVPAVLHRQIVDELFRHGQRATTRISASIEIRFNNLISGGLETVEGVHGMVPASAGAVKKLLKRGRVEEADPDGGGVGKRRRQGRRRYNVGLPEKSCSICWEDYEPGSTVVRMPCLHVFHEDCTLRWLNQSHYCPLCRFELPTIAAT